jgi:hypothetical protein
MDPCKIPAGGSKLACGMPAHTHGELMNSTATELLARLAGTPLSPERLAQVLQAYEPIFAEIAKLHALDLTDVHPAVIFEPTAPYRKATR